MDLKEYIKSLVRKQLEETSATGAIGVGAGPIMTPYAFSKGQKKNAATKQAEEEGWKQTKGETTMPSDSKLYDYKTLTGKKKKGVKIYEMNPGSTFNTAGEYKIDGKEAIYKGIRGTKYLFQTSDGKTIEIDDKDVNKVKKMNESLNDIIKQELLNEVTYSKFKNEVKYRTKAEQLHKAIREVKRKLQEIDRIVEYTQRMKTELSEGDGIQYWNRTNKAVATISEMVNHLNNKIKNLNQ